MELLGLFVLFQVKHIVCDWLWQTRYELSNKGIYGHPGGILHSVKHALCSFPILWLYEAQMLVIYTLVIVEFLLHYHIDWTKRRLMARFTITSGHKYFTWIIVGDQMLHQLTYFLMLALIFVTEL